MPSPQISSLERIPKTISSRYSGITGPISWQGEGQGEDLPANLGVSGILPEPGRISAALFRKDHPMKKLSLLVAVLAVCTATAAQAAKIEVCHRPPGNPDNWHTITIDDNALPAHQAHGDLVGSCLTNCGTLCDDGNKCTIDVVPSTTECLCQAETRPPVDCGDGRACTTDSCDPVQGCANAPVTCPASNPCMVSVCSEPEGTCVETPVVCPTGQACNSDTGACESTGPPCGNCLQPHFGGGCQVAACQAAVCAIQPGCCFLWATSPFNCSAIAVQACVNAGLCTSGPAG